MRKIILTRGIQGSGKSTWAKKWVNEDPEHRIRFNNDDVRNMLGKYWVTSREGLIKSIKENIIHSAMNNNYDIVVDNMNLNDKEVDWFKEVIRRHNESNFDELHYTLEFKDFFIPVEECIARDALRTNPIGEKVIRDTYKRYRSKMIKIETDKIIKLRSKISYDKSLPSAVICDLDATIAFRVDDRPFYGPGCAEGIKNDLPDNSLIRILAELATGGIHILFVTGREETDEIRKATEEWLHQWFPLDKVYYSLYMRPRQNYAKGAEIKKYIYEEKIKDKFNVVGVFEDSKPVVEMYRNLGLLVLQPNDGKF